MMSNLPRHKRRLSRELENTSPSLFPPDMFEMDIDLKPRDMTQDLLEREVERQRKLAADAFRAEMEMALSCEGEDGDDRLLFVSFGSGSSGNCSYLGTHRHGVLIDAGVDREKVEKGLKDNGIDIEGVAGILVTHDHSDHVAQAYALLRRHKYMKLYATPRTLTGILRRHSISRRIKDYHYPVYVEHEYEIGPFMVVAFGTIHDGTDNVGFSLSRKGRCFVVATDMGEISERADYYMRRCNHLMIESNYDLGMLMKGPYAEYLKARIISSRGHLDNAVSAAYVSGMWTPALKDVFLCHLSEDNNRPEKALESMRGALEARGVEVADHSGAGGLMTGGEVEGNKACVRLSVLPRYDVSRLYVLR